MNQPAQNPVVPYNVTITAEYTDPNDPTNKQTDSTLIQIIAPVI